MSTETKSNKAEGKLIIAILVYDGITVLDAIGSYEVLAKIPNVEVKLVSNSLGEKRADTGFMSLSADYLLEDVTHPDILLVPGGNFYAFIEDEQVLPWIRSAHETSKWTASVCAGSLLLGEAGIIDGLTVTTTWFAKQELEKYNATYSTDRYIVNGKIITSAGNSAGIDMAFYLAAQIAGNDIAESIQLILEYDPEPPFDVGGLDKAQPKHMKLAQEIVLQTVVSSNKVTGGSMPQVNS